MDPFNSELYKKKNLQQQNIKLTICYHYELAFVQKCAHSFSVKILVTRFNQIAWCYTSILSHLLLFEFGHNIATFQLFIACVLSHIAQKAMKKEQNYNVEILLQNEQQKAVSRILN